MDNKAEMGEQRETISSADTMISDKFDGDAYKLLMLLRAEVHPLSTILRTCRTASRRLSSANDALSYRIGVTGRARGNHPESWKRCEKPNLASRGKVSEE